MNIVKKKKYVINTQNIKWLIFQPELLLIILTLFFLSSCTDDYDEIVPYSGRTPENHPSRNIPSVLEKNMQAAYEYQK